MPCPPQARQPPDSPTTPPIGRPPRPSRPRWLAATANPPVTQGACTYANICEYCPSFHTDTDHTAALTAQRDATQALAEDASARGWDTETARHQRLITRLTDLIDTTATRPGTI